MHIKLSTVTQPPLKKQKKNKCALGYENEIQHSLSRFSFHNTNYLWTYLSENEKVEHWVDFLVFLSYLCWSLVVLVGNFLDLGFLQQRGVVR